MNGTATRFLRLAVSLAGLVILGLATVGWVPRGQAASPAHHSVSLPTDWSHRHLIFTNPSSPEQLARVSQNTRYWQQLSRREQRLVLPDGSETSEVQLSGGKVSDEVRDPVALSRYKLKLESKKIKRDWSEDLGTGASAGADVYPAKYTFNIHTAFCNGATQPDYVVFPTGLPGAVNQASIVAYDNLYFGCGGATPMDYWAYNTGGEVQTSPVLSFDGLQVGFVQTTAGEGVLVLLKWKGANGSVTLPATPTPVLPAAYLACAAPCMTLVPLQNGSGLPVADTTSSVFYDYETDIAWVGGASGWLHQITGVFKGVPAEVTTGGFPVQMPSGATLTSPVYDLRSGNVFVGDLSGFLYRVNAITGAVTASSQLDFGVGIVDGPIVDSSNHLIYVFASEDNSAFCANGTVNCSGIYQLSTSFSPGATGTEVFVGQSAAVGLPNPLYAGAFDDAYYSSSDATGALYVCGDTGLNAILYQIPIVAGAMPGQGTELSPLANTGSTAACSGITDVLNPNALALPAERLFVSVRNDGIPSNCLSGGCVFNFLDTPWVPFKNYHVGEQILSDKQRVETVITPGTSGGTVPNWSTSPADLDNDGNPGPAQVVWIDQGAYGSGFVTWLASYHYLTPKPRIVDTNGNVEVLTTNGASGTTGATEPTWNMTFGGTTTDGSGATQVVWTNVGTLATASLAAAGGTSGIIIDNVVGPLDTTGDSQIYFTTLSNQSCTTSGGTGGCAVQASQPALQ